MYISNLNILVSSIFQYPLGYWVLLHRHLKNHQTTKGFPPFSSKIPALAPTLLEGTSAITDPGEYFSDSSFRYPIAVFSEILQS